MDKSGGQKILNQRENGVTEHSRTVFGNYFGCTFHNEWRDCQKGQILNSYGAVFLALCYANRLVTTHCYIQVSLCIILELPEKFYFTT